MTEFQKHAAAVRRDYPELQEHQIVLLAQGQMLLDQIASLRSRYERNHGTAALEQGVTFRELAQCAALERRRGGFRMSATAS